jgi:hypothetical protein
MSATRSVNDAEAFSRRGTEIFERDVRPRLQLDDDDKFVAIDIESGQCEIDRDDYAATERLLARRPSAKIWIARAGQEVAYRIGGGQLQGSGTLSALPCGGPSGRG